MKQFVLIFSLLILSFSQCKVVESQTNLVFDAGFYFSASDYPTQIARIELYQQILLNSLEISLDGKGIGEFDLNIYGHEGGARRPVLKKEIMKTIRLKKILWVFKK